MVNIMATIKTFSSTSMTTIDRDYISLDGIKYINTSPSIYEIHNSSLPKMKKLLGNRLYQWALDGSDSIILSNEDIWEI